MTGSDPVDLAALKADEDLLEDLRAGAEPPTDDQVARHLAAATQKVRAGAPVTADGATAAELRAWLRGHDVETRARQIHAVRHRAGTGHACDACRAEAAGTPRPSLLRRILAPRHPHRAGLVACAACVALCVLVTIPAVSAPLFAVGWLSAVAALALAIRWFVLADRADRTHNPR